MKFNFKRLMAMFLSIMMVVGMMPTMVFAEDAVETQTETHVAQVGDNGFATLEEAIKAAQSGDTIVIGGDIYSDSNTVIEVDKNLTITGNTIQRNADGVTLTNVGINAVEGCSELAVTGLTFAGNSWINSGAANKLTVSGVTANVTPVNGNGTANNLTNSRSAFISLGRSEQKELELVVENCNIVANGGADPILGWAAITDATISGNTFGSADAHQANSDSVKFLAIADGATLNFVGNTVYSDYNGIVLGQNTTRENSYTATFTGNTFIGGADHVWVEVSGANTTHAAINAASDNTVNGNAFTVSDIKVHPNVTAWTSYAGVDVVLDENGKVIGGQLAFYADDAIADGYEVDADGNVVEAAPAELEVTPETFSSVLMSAPENSTIKLTASETAYEFYHWAVDFKNITIIGREGATVNKFQVNGTVENLVFQNVTFTAGISFSDTQVNGLTFDSCTFNVSGIAITAGNSSSAPDATRNNVTIQNCTFNGSEDKHALDLGELTGETVIQDNTFENVRNAFQMSVDAGTLLIDDNTITNTSDRAMRLATVGDNVTVTISNNIMTNACDSDNEFFKVTSVGAGSSIAFSGNTYDGIAWNPDTISATNSAVSATVPVAKIGDNGFATLEEAIKAAQSGDTIVLMCDVVLTDTLNITTDITLDGNGHKITPADANATYNSAIMVGNSGWGDDKNTISIKLANLDVSGWKVNYGVVRVQGVSFEMDGCTLSDNTVLNTSYSVVSLNFANSTVKNSVFERNVCPHVIDANYNGDSSTAVITLDNCLFKDNNCSGTGVVYKADGEKIVVSNSKFDGNTVSTNGNAATLYTGWGDSDEVTGCLFTNNSVTTSHATTKRFASAIFCDGCKVNGNAFENNTATRNGEDISTSVAVGAYYGAADVSENYWGGNEPAYTVEFTNHTVSNDSYYTDYSIDADGNVVLNDLVEVDTGLSGSGTEEDPFLIFDIEDLIWFRNDVNSGNTYEGKYVKLTDNIDLTGYTEMNVNYQGNNVSASTFRPIGDTASDASFNGTFDGGEHTISNLYISGWDINYCLGKYGSAGLFGTVDNATIKNLTVSGFEIQVEGGDVAAIAGHAKGDCTFENITVTNSKIATYNNGCAGIVAWSEAGSYTFKDIEITDSVVLAGLWGSFDSSIGGVLAQADNNATYLFEDVDVACRLDIYNDVTASYKYYLYRMCGMLIGRSTRFISGTNEVDADNITCKNVNITIGEWANYTYIWDNTLSYGCKRVEAGYTYDGINVEDYPNSEITMQPMTSIIGGDQYGYSGSTAEELAAQGFDEGQLKVTDLALAARSRIAQVGGEYFTTLQDAIDKANGAEVTLLADTAEEIAIANGANVVINLGGKTLNGCFIPFNANLTISNGTIDNDNGSYSAIEINEGTLNITDVNVTSTRHGVRIDGTVTATINGGTYKVDATSGTRHAINVSGAANVTIKDGTFVGPKGTTMDSGSAVCVQTGAKATITGGNFSGGKNATLGVSGTMSVTGGTFDQDPTAYVAAGYKAVENNGTWTVKENIVLSGSGTETDPYLISNLNELKAFRDSVNEGNAYANQYVKLTADIDLSDEIWIPIGTSNYDKTPTTDGVKMFAGNFDGGNHTITGLTSESYVPDSAETGSTEYSFGLFGYVYGANISNVNLADVDIDCGTRTDSAGNEVYGSGVAALIGYYFPANEKATVIENCHVLSGTVKATNNMGGLIGHMDSQLSQPAVDITIENCSNAADVTTEKREAGGILGLMNSAREGNYLVTMRGAVTFKNCVNTGNITSLGGGAPSAGGILGRDHNQAAGQRLKIVFDSCENSGTITVTANGETHAAGIGAGYYSTGAWLIAKDCENTGNVVVNNPSSKVYAGGLISYGGVVELINSTSTGTVTGGIGNTYVGGAQNILFLEKMDNFTDTVNGYTYYLNGGTSPEYAALVDDAAGGGNFHLVETAYKTGCEFGGWYDNAELTGEAYTALNSSVKTYYAKWIGDEPVAKIGDTTYTSLQAAINAAQNDDEIIVLTDINLADNDINTLAGKYNTYFLVEGKTVTVNLNGKKIYGEYTGDSMLVGVFSTDNNGHLTLTGNGTVDVTATATVYGLLVNYEAGCSITVENGTYTLDKASDSLIYTGGNEDVIINGGTFTLGNVGAGENGSPWIFNAGGRNTAHVMVYSGTFNADINHQYYPFEVQMPKEKALRNNGDSTWTVVDAVAYVSEQEYSGNWYTHEVGYATLSDAIVAADEGETVTLIKDVAITETLKIAKNITLDLNGKTITGTDNATGSFALIEIQPGAELTINDTVGTGKITLAATNNRGWNAYSSVISNQRGKLTVEGGTIEHSGGTDMAYGIDNLTNGKGTYAETIISGGTVKSTYCAIRQFLNGVEAQNILTVNGGTIEGANKSIWMQDPNKNANSGTITVGENAKLIGDVYLFVTAGSTEWPVTVSIASAALADGSTVTSANVPEQYVVKETNGTWGVEANPSYGKVTAIGETYYESFAAALNEVQDGETITILNVEGSEVGTEIDFTQDIEFNITGNAPNYALPVVTFQNATVNIENATILIPELDARQNATINVINSTVYDAGGNSIVKSYYNGAINISGTSVVYTMQVTTMGYITISDTARLNATWQTNVYGNGMITVGEDAQFNTAALQLTGKEYSGRDNTDADRVGKPATIVVDGATFIVGSVKSSNGADYSYNSSGYGVNIGTIEGKSAVLDIKNGATVQILIKDGSAATVGADGTVLVNDSILDGVNLSGAGTTKFYNTVNFYGDNVVNTTNLGGSPFHLIVNKGAILNITRFVLGYDRAITVYGEIEDAHAFDPTDKTPSLKFNSSSGVSVGGTDTGNLTVVDAYIELGNSSWKSAQGTYTWSFENSYVSATSFTNCNAPSSDSANWTVTFDDSVLAAKNYIKNGANTTYNFTNSSVATTGSMRIEGKLYIDATSSVTTTGYQNNTVGADDEHGDITGVIEVDGTLTIGSNAALAVELRGGVLKIGANGKVDLTKCPLSIDTNSKVIIDATGMVAGDYTNLAGTVENNGTLEVINNNSLTAEVQDGKIVLVKKADVAKIGEQGFTSFAEAIAAAKSGDIIVLLADITEDVTVSKSLTIDGGNFKYTGNISVSGTSTAAVVKNMNFENGTGYAITTNRINSITVENCTVTNYGYGFLYANKSTPTVVVKNVTVDGGNYGFHYVYGSNATLENVTMTNVKNGLYIQNYAGKSITLKDCNICSINIWERTGSSGVQTFKFGGANTASALSASQYAKYILGAADATLTAPEGFTVTTTVENSMVKYVEGTYKVVPAVAKIGDTYFETLDDAIAAAQNDDTIVLLADTSLDATVKVNANITLDLGGKTISGTCNVGQGHMIMVAYGADLMIKDSSPEETGKITYAQGTSNTGWVIDVEGDLTLESGTIELTGTSWSIGYAVDVRPNAWGTAYTEATTFTMNGGKLVSSDGAVRVASSSSEIYPDVVASFTMNGGEIEAEWDGVFIQQSNAAWDTLSFTINDGTIKSGLNPIRLYGPTATSYVNGEDCMTVALNGGTLTYTGTEAREWLVEEILRIGGGATADDFLNATSVTASAGFAETNVADGYEWVEGSDGKYTLAKVEEDTLFSLYGANIKLGSDLTMFFYIPKAELESGVNYYATVTKANVDKEATVVEVQMSEWESYNDALYRVAFDGLMAYMMNDEIEVQIFNADGTAVSEIWTDSISTYAHRIYEDQNDSYKTALVDMLNYGAACQTYFGYDAENLANKDLTEEQKNMASAEPSIEDSRILGENYYGSSLTCDSTLILQFYFTNIDETMTAKITYTNAYGREVTETIEGSEFNKRSESLTGVKVGLGAYDVEQLVTCEVYDGDTLVASASDSVESYVARMKATDEVFATIMKFGLSSKTALIPNVNN